jgi:hypothetical protein
LRNAAASKQFKAKVPVFKVPVFQAKHDLANHRLASRSALPAMIGIIALALKAR